MTTFLTFLYVAAYFVVPFGAGVLLSRLFKVRDFATKIGLVLFTIGFFIAPFINQKVRHPELSWKEAISAALPLGIDLAGGTNLIYQVVEKENAPLTPELMDRMVAAVSRRINPSGAEEVTVRRVGTDRIEVIIPGANPAIVEDKKDKMTRLGTLEFSVLANTRDHQAIIEQAKLSPKSDVRMGGKVVAMWRAVAPITNDETKTTSPNPEFDDDRDIAIRQIQGEPEGYKEVLVLFEEDDEQRITGQYLRQARAGMSSRDGTPAVHFTLNQKGAYLFGLLTEKHKPNRDGFHRQLSILLDDKIFSAPQINDVIAGGQVEIHGNFTPKAVDKLVSVLHAGALPAELNKEPISEFTISPTLGADVQSKGVFALWVSTVAVIVFMGAYYLLAGAVADFAMILNLVFIAGAMAFINAAFTLPGLAGLVLSAGMAVDANVLIYERIREETQRGASLRMAIHNGFDKAFTAIIDSHVTTLISSLILYMVGTDQVRGFAVSLFIGLVMNLFTAVYASRIILEIFERTRSVKKLKMFSIIGATNFDFVAKQNIAIAASVVLIVAGMAALIARGRDNLDIDFTGGTMISMQFNESQKTDEVRAKLEKGLGSNITLEELTRRDDTVQGKRFRLRTTDQDETKVEAKVNETFPDQLVRVSMKFGELKAIPAAQETKPAEGDAKTKTPVLEEQFPGGHEVDLEFLHATQTSSEPSEIAPATISRYVANELEKKYPKAESLIALTGTAGSGVSATGNQVRLFNKMRLQVAKDVPQEDVQAALVAVQTKMQNKPLFDEVTSFERAVANEAIRDAILAVVASLVAIIIYLWFRFDKVVFGLATVLALVHDVLVALGCVALGAYLSRTPLGPMLMLTDFKINMSMIAAFLTITGYSTNDTIVIFDRLREIRGKNPVITKEMINFTVNQTLSRTILTALTVIISLVILYVVGGEGIHGFAFCMLIGSIAGTYSTVYIASPLVLWFMKYLPQDTTRRTTISKGEPAPTA